MQPLVSPKMKPLASPKLSAPIVLSSASSVTSVSSIQQEEQVVTLSLKPPSSSVFSTSPVAASGILLESIEQEEEVVTLSMTPSVVAAAPSSPVACQDGNYLHFLHKTNYIFLVIFAVFCSFSLLTSCFLFSQVNFKVLRRVLHSLYPPPPPPYKKVIIIYLNSVCMSASVRIVVLHHYAHTHSQLHALANTI